MDKSDQGTDFTPINQAADHSPDIERHAREIRERPSGPVTLDKIGTTTLDLPDSGAIDERVK